MKTFRRSISLLVIVLFLFSSVFGCQSRQAPEQAASTQVENSSAGSASTDTEETGLKLRDMKIKVYTAKTNELKRQPVENKLVDIWREKTKVTPEFVFLPPDMSQDQWIQMQIAAGTLPEVIHSWDLMRSAVAIDALKKADMIYTLDADMIKKYMPHHVENMAAFDVTTEQQLKANLWNDGKNYYLPEFNPKNTAKYNDTKLAKKSPRFMESYFFYLRDDILKKIFPTAKTEKELRDLYVQKGGNLTIEELFGDIPIKNKDDLINYMRQVRDLKLKVGDKPVIPGQILGNSSLQSAIYTASTVWFGVWQGGYSYKGDKWTDLYSDPGFKDYMKWMNTLYNEKLIDPEVFIQTGEQLNAKINNGEYAVVNFMIQPGMADARKLAIDQKRDYGYRMMPAFLLPLVTETQDLTYLPTTLFTTLGVFFTKSIKEEDLPQVLNWMDWNISSEAQELRSWGTPEFYTGDGEQRRFKAEYKDIEVQKLSGTENPDGKDATYYGLNSSDLSNIEAMLFQCPSYYEVPANVYPAPPVTDVTSIQLDTYIYFTVGGYYPSQAKYYNQSDWSYTDVIGEDFKKAWDIFFADNNWSLATNAVIGPVEKFDAKWDEYVKAAYTPEFVKLRQETADKWKKLYNEKIIKDIEAQYGKIN